MSQVTSHGRLWIRVMKKHRMVRSAMVECTRDDPTDALRRALPPLDLSQPLWLPRHQADWEQYALTRFLPDHFVDQFPYDSMEISYVYPDEAAKPARRRSPLEDA